MTDDFMPAPRYDHIEAAARLLRTGRVRAALLLPRGAASRIRSARTAVGRVRASA